MSGNPYSVRWSVFSSGERMPFLRSAASGLPLEAPTYWITAYRRGLGRQPNTLFNDLRALMFLYLWADTRGLDLDRRLAEGTFFNLAEIVALADFCGRSMRDVLREMEGKRDIVARVVTPKSLSEDNTVSPEKQNRLLVIRSFIEFTTADHLSQFQNQPARYAIYKSIRQECLDRIGQHAAAIRAPNRDDVGQPEGLDPEVVKRLLFVTEPEHSENPFATKVRCRNQLMIRALVELGMRRGELLGLYVSDCVISGSSGTITIHRRPDDRNDSRRDKPAAKTAARVLPISGALAELLHEWVVVHRTKLPLARTNPFLIVTVPSGRPMSLSNVNKMFETIRKRVSGMPDELGPHLLRHSWNDTFSRLVDCKGNVSPEDEAKWRKLLMGWRSEKSAQPYLKRTIKRKSNEFLAEMQQGFDIRMGEKGDDA